MKKNKNRFSLLFIVVLVCVILIPLRTLAVSSIEKKYTTSNCVLNRNSDYTYIPGLGCSFKNIKDTSYVCEYYYESGGNVSQITAYFNADTLSSIDFKEDISSLIQSMVLVGKNKSSKVVTKGNVEYYTCPSSLYQESSNFDDKNNLMTRYVGTVQNGNEIEWKLQTKEENLVMAIKKIDNGEIESDPVREPLTCTYQNNIGSDGVSRKLTITYHSSNNVSATYFGDINLNMEVDVSAIKNSEYFKNWECPSEDNVYISFKNNKKYVSYDKNDDSDHKFTGINNFPNGDSQELTDKCKVIPDAIKTYLKQALKLIRWGALVLMVILGTLDFVKAAAADDQDSMKKASQNFIKRLIAVIILFLLPLLLEAILRIAGLLKYGEECGFNITDF